MLQPLTEKLLQARDLSPDEARAALDALLGDAADSEKAEFLLALSRKGETVQEIAAFALAVRERAVDPGVRPENFGGILLDVCGTGADGLHTLNVSTAAMFVVASAGIAVAKHGNRGITSRCGGADVLEALGVQIEMPPEKFRRCIEQAGVGFLFAPLYHPAFKKIAPVRKQLAAQGVRTVFNILGPLVNPARANAQLLGVFDAKLTTRMAEVLKLMGHRRALVVHGAVSEKTLEGERPREPHGLDEISTLGPTQISELTQNGEIKNTTLDPAALEIEAPRLEELIGDDAAANAKILRDILSGRERGAKADLVALNAAAALWLCGRAKDWRGALQLAREQIASGAAQETLEKMITFSQGN